jgi:hypothetical protein
MLTWVAFVVVQVRVEDPPCSMAGGLTMMWAVAAGGGGGGAGGADATFL